MNSLTNRRKCAARLQQECCITPQIEAVRHWAYQGQLQSMQEGGHEGRIDQKRRILGKTNKSAYLVEDNMDKGWGDGVNSCHTEPEA